MPSIKYRPLKGYKYMLMEPYEYDTGWRLEKPCGHWLILQLTTMGMLKIAESYCWDGPSGTTIDTPNFMRGSLVHDALYQFIREGQLPANRRKDADDILRRICRVDGMSPFRAWYVYHSVRAFGGAAIKPRDRPEVEIVEAP